MKGDTVINYGTFWNTVLTAEAQNEAAAWYTYDEAMKAEMRCYVPLPQHQQALSDEAFAELLAEVRDYATRSVALGLPYHNEIHLEEYARDAVMLFDRMFGEAAHGELLFLRQMIELAGWLHDCHHSGCTLRADARLPLYLPELGTDVSVEYVSALAAYRLLRGKLPLPAIVFIVTFIWSTTYAGKIAAERGIRNVPAVHQPRTPCFALSRVADVWPVANSLAALIKGAAANCGEMPATGVITDTYTLVRQQIGFEHYRIEGMQHLDNVCGKSVTADGQERSLRHIAEYEALLRGERPEMERKIIEVVQSFQQ